MAYMAFAKDTPFMASVAYMAFGAQTLGQGYGRADLSSVLRFADSRARAFDLSVWDNVTLADGGAFKLCLQVARGLRAAPVAFSVGSLGRPPPSPRPKSLCRLRLRTMESVR